MFLMGSADHRGKTAFFQSVRLTAAFLLLVLFQLAAVTGTAEAKPQFSAIAVDARTGTVLFSRDADGLRHPASLTKVMTLYVLFEELKAGRIKLSTPLRVSKRASGMAPSKLGLKPGSTITVDQAIRALVTKSANDVATTVGENLESSEAAFAKRMTQTARRIGMSRSVFRNASGLPDPAQVTTARDMATLSLRIQRDFPQYYPYFKISNFNFKGRSIRTHNKLLGRFEGTDGIKTGYIRASGFNLTTSAQRGKKRIVGVVMGGSTGAARDRYMMSMLSEAFPKCKDGTGVVASIGGVLKSGTAVASAEENSEKVQKRSRKSKSAEAAAAPKPVAEPVVEEIGDGQPAIGDDDRSALDEMMAEQTQTPDIVQASAATPPMDKLPFEVKQQASVDTGHGSNWSIQVGAYPTRYSAESKIDQARKTAAKQLSGKQGVALEYQTNGETIYRARFLGFSERSANEACRQLEKKGINCLMLAPQG